MHDIKKLAPRSGRFKQGVFEARSMAKVFPSQTGQPIIYRSGLERDFIVWLETSPDVIRWGSECVKVPYTSPLDGKRHTYYPDFLMETKDGPVLVEVKPYAQTRQPGAMAGEWDRRTWAVNRAKWGAALAFASKYGCRFMIVTERTIKRLKNK